MRLLYLYAEEWTGRRAREVHTLSTCAALTQAGVNVTLVTAGGLPELRNHLRDVTGQPEVPGLQLVALSRQLGPIRSASFFGFHFRSWLRRQEAFDWGYIIHLKAAAMLTRAKIPYAYEAHEIFAESKQNEHLADLEKSVLNHAALDIATSQPLADALHARYSLPGHFAVVPNAGLPALEQSVAAHDGPFVYAGSIADWKGLDLVIQASRDAQVPLKIIGGSAEEWQQLSRQLDTSGITWQPRVPLNQLPEALSGARAGLIPTRSETASGHYSCPMKLFDYARCGLPVLTTALVSLQSLEVGPWCVQLSDSTRDAWAYELKSFHFDADQTESARAWSNAHTWRKRADLLVRAFAARDVRV